MEFTSSSKRFIRIFSEISQPLTDLIKKNYRINACNQQFAYSFNALKEKLTNSPTLIALKWNREFRLHTHASVFATGATLTEIDEDGRDLVIAYTSKKMNADEHDYSANDTELLDLVNGLQRFRYYLLPPSQHKCPR